MSLKLLKKELGWYAPIHGTKAGSDCFNEKYPKYNLVRTSADSWKKKIGSKSSQTPFEKKVRPNLLNDNLLKNVKYVMIGTGVAGAVISRRLVIAIGKGVVKSNNPTMLMENGGPLELTEDWARGVLKSLEWKSEKQRQERWSPRSNFLKRKN